VVRAPSSGPAVTPQDILRILRKRKWMIIITATVIAAVVFVATLLWYLYWPLYTAAAQLQVTPPINNPMVGGIGLAPKDIMERLLESHAQVAKSNMVLEEALRDPKITRTRWYAKDKINAVERLYEDIDVRPMAGTSYIQVSMTGRAPTLEERAELADIVNALAQAFVKVHQATISGQRRKDIEAWKAQVEVLRKELTSVRRKAKLAKSATNVPTLEKQRSIVDVQRNLLTQELIKLQMALTQADAALKALAEQEASGSINMAPEVLAALDMDPTLRLLKNTEMNMAMQQEALTAKYAPGHPQAKSLSGRLETIRNEIKSRESMVTQRAVDLLKSERTAVVNSVNSQILDVQQRLNQANSMAADVESSLTELAQLAGDEDDLENRIRKIEDRVLELQQLADREQQVSLWIPASPPREISMPKWVIMMPLGVFLGMAVGLGLAFTLEFIDTSIKSPSDISRRVDLPLLGMVPHTDDLEDEIQDMRQAFMTNPNSLVGEAFRQIRTCLLFSGPASQRRSLLITSPLPEDGRTTIALNLAAAVAHGGRRVLVVDANFRQPGIRQIFPQCPDGGLSSALVGQANWQDLLHEVQPNLHVLPAGMLPPNPAELLGSEEMRKLLAEMVDRYDQILIDGAPCLVVTDSSVLATLVDGVIVTVRAGANTYGIVQRTRDILLRVGAHVVGVVLNGVRATAGGYLRKNYETFYEYHEQAKLPAK